MPRTTAPALLAALLFTLAAPAQSFFRSGFEAGETGPAPPKSGLGTNLESVVEFAAAYPFTDFFKQSRPWIAASQTVFDTGRADELDLDADGWVQSLPPCNPGNPNQFCIARTTFNEAGAAWPGGQYLVIYEGQGQINYGLGASRVVAASVPGRDVVQVDGNSIWTLDVVATGPAPNHIRNIRVLPPGFDPAVAPVPRFHPDFVAELAPYRSIRFMDWMETNGGAFSGGPNEQENFADRPRLTDARWNSEKGVPLEAMIELANATGTEPWFTLPHRVDDGYVDGFAAIVLAQLDPTLDVYLEYSNEVWNPAFPQGTEIEQRGNQLFGSLGDPFIRRLNAHGLRTAQICQRFKAVFGSQSGRVICTLGAQAANAFTQTEAADCPLAVQVGLRSTACGNDMDAVAIAPYFANYTNVPVNQNEIQGWTLDQLFAELVEGGQLQDTPPNVATPCTENFPPIATQPCPVSALEEVMPWTTAHKSAATARGLRLVAYEGGQHLVGVFGVENDEDITDLFIGANRDARMGPIYQSYLESWKDNGGELFALFGLSGTYTRFGSWGIVERLGQTPRPPKAQAILDFNAANPCWWPDCGSGAPPPPPPPPPSCTPVQLLGDPGLEATDFGNPSAPTNPSWTSTSQRFGSVLCNAATCGNDGGLAVPRGGGVFAWFGGTLAGQHAEVSTLRQTVTIPSGDPRHLNFFLRRSVSTAPLDATLAVKVDGSVVRSFAEPASPEAGYVGRTIDLSAFADGQPHLIEFEYVNGADGGKSNFLVDDVTLECTASGQ